MLKLAIIGAVTILALPAVAEAFPSPPIYPSFAAAPAKKAVRPAPIYPSFASPKASTSPTITTFDVPGATAVEPAAINDSGVIVGTYAVPIAGPNATSSHGFIRAADGTITTFDAPGVNSSGSTVAKAINASGTIVGFYFNINGGGSGSFIRTADGTFTQFSIPTSTCVPEPTGINDQGYVAGIFCRETDEQVQPVFLRKLNGYVQKIYAPFASGIVSINASGTIAGGYSKHSAFVLPLGGVLTKFHTADQFTLPVGINAVGTIAGYYGYMPPGAKAATFRAFVRSSDGTITKYRVPDATNTWAGGINDSGVVAGYYQGKAGNFAGFMRAPDGTITRFHLPHAKASWVTGLNNSGMVIGEYNVSNNPQKTAGFIVTP